MKIKRYPGKAVINDPSWLEMDGGNRAMDLLYAANWLDTQRSLSSSSSASNSNSWDRNSSSSTEPNVSTSEIFEEETLNSKPENTALTEVTTKKSSKPVKYHSDKYLSRIASKNKNIDLKIQTQEDLIQNSYYLPSQTKLIRQRSFRTGEESISSESLTRQNSLRTSASFSNHKERKNDKISRQSSFRTIDESIKQKTCDKESAVKYKNVINDLQAQLVNSKKSVRFHEKSIEIQDHYSNISEESYPQESQKHRIKQVNNKTTINILENPLNDEQLIKKHYKSTTVQISGDEVTVDVTNGTNTPEEENSRKDSNEMALDRINDWINDQNQYISRSSSNVKVDQKPSVNKNITSVSVNETSGNSYDGITHPYFQSNEGQTEISLINTSSVERTRFLSRVKNHDQTDEEFYEQLVNSRQRLPASKTGFNETKTPSHLDLDHMYENEEIMTNTNSAATTDNNVIHSQPRRSTTNNTNTNNNNGSSSNSDFAIPRPKLIVPVHTYAIRKRRTGNLHSRISECSRNDANVSSIDGVEEPGEL